jgi:hypothetical protein
MSRRSRTAWAASAAAIAVLALGGGAPASAFPGPSDQVADLVDCGTGEVIGGVRFRDDGGGKQRLVVFGQGEDAADLVVRIEGRNIEAPGLPGDLALDGGGGGRFVLRSETGEIKIDETGLGPAINVTLDGLTIASTDPANEC